MEEQGDETMEESKAYQEFLLGKDALQMGTEVLDDDFRYANEPTKATIMPSNKQASLEGTPTLEVVPGDTTQPLHVTDEEATHKQSDDFADDKSA